MVLKKSAEGLIVTTFTAEISEIKKHLVLYQNGEMEC